tara:strand:+ start:4210 stop:5067 length:858 start_codon:yes stop_codon:yes gene_type:complete
MTNGDRPNAYEEVISGVAFAENIKGLENDHERGDTGRSNPARDSLVNLATQYYTERGEYVPEDGLEFGDEQYQAGIGFVKTEAEQGPRDVMAGSLDDVVSEMPDEKVDNLFKDKTRNAVLVGNAGDDDREVLAKYGNYKQIEDLHERYSNDREVSSEEGKIIQVYTELGKKRKVDEAGERAYEREMNTDEDGSGNKRLASIAKTAARISELKRVERSPNESKEYALEGLQAELDASREAYEELGRDYQESLRESLKALTEKGTEELNTAVQMVYDAHVDRPSGRS